MKKTLLLFACLALFFSWANAQTRVTGTVTEQNGTTPMPYVTVSAKGTAAVTTTDAGGKYVINVPAGATTLVFSFVGMQAEEVNIGGRNVIDVSLAAEGENLDEAVVTAYGIKRERKAINYAVQELKGDDLLKSKESNIVNSLAGRIAGVNITRSSGDVGASSQIVIRGGQSLTGNNQPLFIVDGVPIDNTSMSGMNLAGMASSRSMDEINRAADIDAEDVESITVLKGPAASALYGIDAAGGAIVITTKKGEKGEGRIKYTNNFKWSRLIDLPEVQQTYGAGYNGYKHRTLSSPNSWGPMLDETQKRYNNIDAFFETGFSQKHSIEFSKAYQDGSSIRLSGSYSDESGIVPNMSYKQFNARATFNTEVKKWFRIAGSAAYVTNTSDKSPKGETSYYRYLMEFPIDYDITDWYNPVDGTQKKLWPSITIDNPFWNVYRSQQYAKTDRLMSNVALTVEPLEGLTAVLTAAADFYKTDGHTLYEPGSAVTARKDGSLYQYVYGSNYITANARVSYNKTLLEGLIMDAMVIGEITDNDKKTNSITGVKFQVPNYYSINNFSPNDISTSYTVYQKRRVAATGDLKLEYKNMIYLNATFRQDWSSTLPAGHQGFSSPSASIGFIASELLPANLKRQINFFKVSAIWARAGKDPDPYVTTTGLFRNDNYPSGGFYNDWTGGAPDLRAEKTDSWEINLNTKFLDSRLGFDFTYYEMYSKDMIINPRVSFATKGTIMQYINGGEISNKGVELSVTGRPIDKKGILFWEATVNFSKNKGVIESLPYPLEYYYDSETWVIGNIRVGAYPGQPYSTLQGFDYERDPNGKVIVNASTGNPVRLTKYVPVGNREPDFMIGIVNNFRILNDIHFSFLLDIRKGGDVYNGTAYRLVNNGAHTITENRDKMVVIDGVNKVLYTSADQTAGLIPNGMKVGDVKEYVKNTTPVRMGQTFFESYYSNVETNFVEEVNWLRLRNVSLSYDLPKKFANKLHLDRVRVNFSADNLLLFTNYSGVEPEVNTLGAGRNGLGGAGIDFGSVPSSRSYSLGFSVTF